MSSFSLIQDGAPDFSPVDFYGSFFKVIVVLAVIIGLIVLVIRFLAVKNKQWAGNRAVLRTHAGITLGQHKSLQIVEVGGTLYIVGVGDSISLIDKIDDEERAAALLASLAAKPAPGFGPAAESLGRWLSGRSRGESPKQSKPADKNEAFQALLQDKLKTLGNRKETLKAWMEEEPKRDSSDDR